MSDDFSLVVEARSLEAFGDATLENYATQYDLLVVDHPHIPQAAKLGALRPLDAEQREGELDLLAASSVGGSQQSYNFGNRQWALAIDAAAQVAAWRPDLLAVPPKTLEDVIELAAAGRVVWPGKPVDAFSSFCSLAAHFGHPVAKSRGFVDEETGAQVFHLLRTLVETCPRQCLDADPVAVAEMLAEGDRYCYAPLLFGYTNYSRPGFRANRIRYGNLPFGPGPATGSCLGGAGIAVSATSKYPDVAEEFAFFLAGERCQRGVYYTSGGQPAHALAWSDPALNEDSLDFFSGTRETLEGAWIRPQHVRWPEFQNDSAAAIHLALRDNGEFSTLLETLNTLFARHLSEAET